MDVLLLGFGFLVQIISENVQWNFTIALLIGFKVPIIWDPRQETVNVLINALFIVHVHAVSYTNFITMGQTIVENQFALGGVWGESSE